jgi:hypothetical protein
VQLCDLIELVAGHADRRVARDPAAE